MKNFENLKLFAQTILFFSLLFLFNKSFVAQDIKGYDQMIEELVLDSVPYIGPSELFKNKSNVVYILDTREKSEFKISHIPNAIHVGYLFFNMKSLKDIPKDAEIITYCSVGYRSGKLGSRLMRKGYTNVRNLKGGLFSWANKKLPMVNSKDKPTTDVHGYNRKWSQWLNKKNCEVVL